MSHPETIHEAYAERFSLGYPCADKESRHRPRHHQPTKTMTTPTITLLTDALIALDTRGSGRDFFLSNQASLAITWWSANRGPDTQEYLAVCRNLGMLTVYTRTGDAEVLLEVLRALAIGGVVDAQLTLNALSNV